MTKREFMATVESVRNPRLSTLSEALALEGSKAIQAIEYRMGTKMVGPRHEWVLTPAEFALFRVLCFIRSVSDGGFANYFETESGDDAERAKVDLRAIPADSYLALLNEASSVFDSSCVPENYELRLSLLDKIEAEGLRSLDETFFDLDKRFRGLHRDGKELNRLLVLFVEINQEQFAIPSSEVVQKFKSHDRISAHIFGKL